MKILSAYYRQRGEKSASLLLQQYSYKGTELCFACICEHSGTNSICKESGDSDSRISSYMSEQLLRWFYKLPLKKILSAPGRSMEHMAVELQKVISRVDRELEDSGLTESGARVGLAGVFALGETVLLLHRGEARIFLINTAFERVHLQALEGGEAKGEECDSPKEIHSRQTVKIEHVVWQRDVGLLLTAASFLDNLTEVMLKEGLFVGEVRTEQQMYRHLRELAEEGRRLGGTDMSAIMLRSTEEITSVRMGQEKDMVASAASERGIVYRRHPGKEGTETSVPVRGYCNKNLVLGSASVNSVLQGRGLECCGLLGQGAFSKVYRVKRRETGFVYACKISDNSKLLRREYDLLRELAHPLFPEAFDFWQEGEKAYLLMEYISGSSLKEMAERRGGFPVKQIVNIGVALAEGLLYLHERPEPIVFRDVKPENIMVRQDGRIKLLDFGCACEMDYIQSSRAGTPGFAAPEQLDGTGILTPASDVYGVGQTLRVLLGDAGKRDRFARKLLEQILEACTRKEPAKRLPDMRSLLAALISLDEKITRKKCRWSYGNRNLFRWDIECLKNIWESDFKNA